MSPAAILPAHAPQPPARDETVPPRRLIALYHERSKHRFGAYAPGPGALDWDTQPAPFRHYRGAPVVSLPLAAELTPDHPLRERLAIAFGELGAARPPHAASLDSLGLLLQLSLGLTGWKLLGPDRWAVRANPSSGNLHPVEAWVIARCVPGLADGVHHYRPEDHALECRAQDPASTANAPPRLLIALSTVMWREAWKYGERAFRYCQLDVGHAVGALRHAAALLGWTLGEVPGIGTATLAQRLGLDRARDYPAGRHPETEREEAEIVLAVGCDGALPAPLAPAELDPPAPPQWRGTASPIDPRPMYRWPIVGEVAAATRRADALAPTLHATPAAGSAGSAEAVESAGSAGSAGRIAADAAALRPAAEILLGRRSAQRFTPCHVMPGIAFAALLDALVPHGGAPWDALASANRLTPVLFVHRVEGLAPGLYLAVRDAVPAAGLIARLRQRFAPRPVALPGGGPELLFLKGFAPVELHRLARSLHCHQDIAANACFALGLLAPFEAAIAADPAAYRELYREAGLIGQVLYLQTEALGLRGTGIGCFFDDPVHTVLGLEDHAWQTLYHFTVGMAVDDPRIENAPPYPASRRPAPSHPGTPAP